MPVSLNRVTLLGNLGADPEEHRTQDGRLVVSLRIATTDVWRDKLTNERRERTEWHRVVIFVERLAEVAKQHLKKGAKVFIEGSLHTSEWEDAQKQKRYTTEVVLRGFNANIIMLDRPATSDFGGKPQGPIQEGRSESGAFKDFTELSDDEIPF